jgi:hypothetical protein
LALEFFTRFRGGSFQPLTHLSASDKPLVQFLGASNSRFLAALGMTS